MGAVHYNGLHWNNWPAIPSQDKTLPQPQYKAGQQFSAAMIIASGNISYTTPSNGTFSTNYNGWKDVVSWIQGNTARTGEIVLRLFWPSNPNALNGDPGGVLGTGFYNEIVKPAVQVYGIRNFQVLNELNLEYTGKLASQIAGDMYNIAYNIKQKAQQDGLGFIYLGFPGPGGDPGDPTNPGWNAYWSNYASVIGQNTVSGQGSAYNWLAVHAYDYSDTALTARMQNQYTYLKGKFAGYPHRWTEYSINQVPPNVNYAARAGACKNAIVAFKNWVPGQNGPDVWALFYYIAWDSADQTYELVQNNANLGPASTLASAF